MVDELPEALKRYRTRAGQDALAARLGLTIDPYSQDWEWEIAQPEKFDEWLAVFRTAPLSDDERFSLMETLIQCVEDMVLSSGPPAEVEALSQWQAVAALLQERPRLHASSIAYWSVFGHDDPEEQFRVSVPMRRVWAAVRPVLG
ncbi:Uncharacterized protein OS=Rhodopirellula baltica SWK14 GN=RBSWK_06258 PE=4 SV=1 [Gemmataceae bacterium]|nr:Uncharacterized protein OS=Rhodopirellula baltica SWK14 GN=RBSWK_06258 PE=4 SV=1 [Gemmataceae bacterium]VTU01144.1 Uncharacterized protein OS=Rhodopirellula baltica SWK14 GN=RBSWK_06258 PE=4 SV=1 [Gemmataceae bacterium]